MHAPARPGLRPTAGFIILMGAMTAFGAMSIDLYLPALPSMAKALQTDAGAAQQTVSTFLAGLAIGQIVYGPLSDRIGRRPPLFAGMALYITASIGCALADSIGTLAALRFVQGLGACAAMVIARAVVRDRFDHADTARVFSWITLVFGVAPVLAPLIGSLLLTMSGWRAIFWSLGLFGLMVAAASVLWLPETRGAAARLRAAENHPVAVYRALLSNRRLLGFMLTAAFASASLFAYVSASPALFISDFGFSPFAFSLIFGSNALALVAGAQLNRVFLRRLMPDEIAGRALIASLAVGVAFAGAAVTGQAGPWVTYGALFLMLGLFGLTSANLQAGALNVDPDHAGSIAALLGLSGFGIGALVASAAAAAHDGTARPLAFAVLVSYGLAVPAYHLLARGR